MPEFALPKSRATRTPGASATAPIGSSVSPATAPSAARVARALLGATSDQLAAHIGSAPSPKSESRQHGRAINTIGDLAHALSTIVGWYGNALGASQTSPLDASADLDGLVGQYLQLRSRFERREAEILTADSLAAMTGRATRRQTSPSVSIDGAMTRRRALLVDDASDILVTVGAFLESFGFEVAYASNGDTALQILAAGAPFDLLVTDHAMPGMTGRDLVLQSRHMVPGLRALIITGFPGDAELATLPAGDVRLLAKPFRRTELSLTIRKLFGEGEFAAAPIDRAQNRASA